MSKGSGRRPTSVPHDLFAARWRRALERKETDDWVSTLRSLNNLPSNTDRAPAGQHCPLHNRVLPCLPCKLEGGGGEQVANLATGTGRQLDLFLDLLGIDMAPWQREAMQAHASTAKSLQCSNLAD